MSYSGYQFSTGSTIYDQRTTGNNLSLYSQSQPVYGSMAQYRGSDQGTSSQYANASNSSSYDYSYSKDYYNQNQAPQPTEYIQQSHVSYNVPTASATDSYYSYNVNTAQTQPGRQSVASSHSHYNSNEGLAPTYSGEQSLSNYDSQTQYQHQYQQTAHTQQPYQHTSHAHQQQQQYQQPPHNQHQRQHYQQMSHNQQQQQQYQESSHTQPQSQYQYDPVTHSSEVYGVSNSTQSGTDNHSYLNTSEGPWATENQRIESTSYYDSEPPSTGGYQNEPPRYASSNVHPGADNRNSFASYSENNGKFSSVSESGFSASAGRGYINDRLKSKANLSEPEPFQSNKTEFGGYSGPAPSSRGNWKRCAERGRGGIRGGLPARGRASSHQDSRGSSFGSCTGGAGTGPLQIKSEHGGNWRVGGNQSQRPADFQSSPSYGARKRLDGPDNHNRGHEGRQGFSRGAGFSLNSSRGKLQPPAYASAQLAKPPIDDGPVYQTPRPYKKPEVIKAPSRPQDRLLNEVECRSKAAEKRKPTPEELKKKEEERKKAEEEEKKKVEEERMRAEEVRKKAEEEALKRAEEEKKRAEEEQKKAAEELRKKLADEAVKAAPPSKPPETAEEIAYEEEIQRKIRESVVVLTSTVDEPPPTVQGDPMAELEMSEELRELLKSITTQYLCKLCSVRIVGPQMAGMHYNGKNHLKKLRNFVQTNGRSAGFYLGVEEQKTKETKDDKGKDGENKAEAVEATVIKATLGRHGWSGQG